MHERLPAADHQRRSTTEPDHDQQPAIGMRLIPSQAQGDPDGPVPDEEVHRVPLHLLQHRDSPRLDGVDMDHVHALVAMDADLPPILVLRSTMEVIDGAHRVRAAQLCGRTEIDVQYFTGNQEQAFVLAVRANVRHGLPLTLADRRSAAARIVSSYPQASDRWIAAMAGLAAKTVAVIRRNAGQPMPESRIGRDGRLRPLDTRDRRRIAADLIAVDPGASLRKIAKAADLSLGTARDVREKVRLGIDPTVTGQVGREPGQPAQRRNFSISIAARVDCHSILQRLQRDPTLRYSDSGRSVLRFLSGPRLIERRDWLELVALVPEHRLCDVADIARTCALAWGEFANELDQRIRPAN